MTINLHNNENPYLPDENIQAAAIKGLARINKFA